MKRRDSPRVAVVCLEAVIDGVPHDRHIFSSYHTIESAAYHVRFAVFEAYF